MRGLAILVALVLVAAAVWLIVHAVRRGRARRRLVARWTVEQWSTQGHTVVGVRRRPEPHIVTDQIEVASIPDADGQWLDRRAAAWAEATARAVELNATTGDAG